MRYKKTTTYLFIIGLIAVNSYAVLTKRINTFPFTDYHIFAESVYIKNFVAYRIGYKNDDGSFSYVHESPIVYEFQNAFNYWVSDFVISQQRRVFDPSSSQWIPRTNIKDTFQRLPLAHRLPADVTTAYLFKVTTQTGHKQNESPRFTQDILHEKNIKKQK